MGRTSLPATQVLENSSEKLARLITATGVKVQFSSAVKCPCADIVHNTILMPALPPKVGDKDFRRLQGAIDHEAAHVLYTYTSDGQRPPKSPGYTGHIENTLEDGRINKLMCERFLGSNDNLKDSTELISELIAEKMAEQELEGTPEQEAFFALVKASYRYVWGRPDVADLICGGDDLMARMPSGLAERLSAVTTFEDVKALVKPVADWLGMSLTPPPPQESEDESEGEGEGKDGEEGEGKGQNQSQDSDSGASGSDQDESDGEGQAEGSEGSEGDSDGQGDDSDGDSGEGESDGDESEDGDGSESGSGEGEGEGEGDDGEGSDGDGSDSDGDGEGESSDGTSEGSPDMGGTDEDLSASDKVNPEDRDPEVVEGMQGVKAAEVSTERQEEFERIIVNLAKEVAEALAVALPSAASMGDYDGQYVVDTSHDKEVSVRDLMKSLRRYGYNDEQIARLVRGTFVGYRAKVGPLRARLVMDLQSTGKVWQKDLQRGRTLDTSNLTRARFADSRVFKNKNRKDAIDTAVTLLVDCSGSMAGDPLQKALQLAALFGEALEMANVPCEILGFTTQGSGGMAYGMRNDHLLHVIFKGFNETVRETRDSWVAINGATANNVDGESVMWAAKRLAKRREERKIMMVLSDGYPAAAMRGVSYHGTLAGHLRETVKRVESAGIETLGIGIMDDAPKHFYPKNVRYDSLDDLMKGVYKTISTLLRTGKLVANHAA